MSKLGVPLYCSISVYVLNFSKFCDWFLEFYDIVLQNSCRDVAGYIQCMR